MLCFIPEICAVWRVKISPVFAFSTNFVKAARQGKHQTGAAGPLQMKDSYRPDTTASLTDTSPGTYATAVCRRVRWCERSARKPASYSILWLKCAQINFVFHCFGWLVDFHKHDHVPWIIPHPINEFDISFAYCNTASVTLFCGFVERSVTLFCGFVKRSVTFFFVGEDNT